MLHPGICKVSAYAVFAEPLRFYAEFYQSIESRRIAFARTFQFHYDNVSELCLLLRFKIGKIHIEVYGEPFGERLVHKRKPAETVPKARMYVV